MNIKDRILKLIDAPALLIAMAIDIALVSISLIVISPGPIEKVGMGMLSLVVVAFAVRAWVKGGILGKTLWVLFALVAFFFDMSFALVSTDVQSVATVDAELVRLTAKVDSAEAKVSGLQDQYDKAGTRATMDQLAEQIATAEAQADKYRADRETRLSRQESGASKEITSAALSTAIWDAATSGKPGRVTYLIIFAILFAGMQLTMVLAAGEKIVYDTIQAPRQERKFVVKRSRDIETVFVRLAWQYKRNGRSKKIMPREAWYTLARKRGAVDGDYERLAVAVQKAGLVGLDGTILEQDEEKVLHFLRGMK